MKVVRLPLQSHTHFHFGEFKADSDIALASTSSFMHSDTLFSALVNSYSELKGGAEDLINDFKTDKLRLSSLFYYIKKEKEDNIIYLLPKPVFLDLYGPRDGQHKKRNRIQWVSLAVWQKGFDGQLGIEKIVDDNKNDTVQIMDDYLLIQNDSILLTKEEADSFGFNGKESIYTLKDKPKNRRRGKEDVYYETDIEIGNLPNIEIGFYFMYDTSDENVFNKLQSALDVLQNTGIGGEKSYLGSGILGFEENEIDANKTPNGYDEIFINLSLVVPKDKDELNNIEYYKTLLRGGAGNNGADADYDVIRMIKEGAKIKTNTITGNIVVLGKDFKDRDVFRNGKAFIIPAFLKKNQQ